MKKYIQPSIQTRTYAQELMTIGLSDSMGDEHEFNNQSIFFRDEE